MLRAQFSCRLLVVLFAGLVLAPQCTEVPLTIRPSTAELLATPIGLVQRQSFTVTNPGAAAVTLGELSNAGLGLEPPFSVIGGTCVGGGALAVGARCQLDIEFAPTQVGRFVDAIELTYAWQGDAAPTRVVSHPLAADGQAAIADHDLGDHQSNVGSVRRIVFTVVNRSGYAVTLGEVSNAGLGLAPPFALAPGSCASGQVLSALSGWCSIEIDFRPMTTGEFSGEVSVAYRWPGSDPEGAVARARFLGTATGPLSVEAGPYLGIAATGAALTETYTLVNAGEVAATLGEISSAGLRLASPFSWSGGSCASGAHLAAGASCTLDVRFSATAPQTASDAIELSYVLPGGIELSLVQPVVASAAQAAPADCFVNGCAPGHVCWQVTSTPSGAGTCVEVPPPPPACMAPCLWEARRNCLPAMRACRYSDGNGAAVKCDPVSGWAIDYRNGAGPLSDRQWRSGEGVCFSESIGRIGTTPVYSYTNGSAPIASASGSVFGASTNVYCGPYASIDQVPDAERDEPFRELPTVACADWKATYLELTECRSTTPGTCAAPTP